MRLRIFAAHSGILCRLAVFVIIAGFGGRLYAGTGGKLAGRVTDSNTGKPLAGVNVIISGTSMGAATDENGQYLILNIPPGVYEVRFSIIGYVERRYQNVRILVDLTTRLDVSLSQSVIKGQQVTVTAQRPLVQPDITYSQANIGRSELQNLPVEELEDAVALQAGVVLGTGGEMHIRGGRSSEITYMVDGIPVTDPYNAGMGVEVENNAIQELQLISGTFNAEYGQAMSGVINIITREGDKQRYQGRLTLFTGRYASAKPQIYFGALPSDLAVISNAAEVDPWGFKSGAFVPPLLQDVQLDLSGPWPGLGGKATFFVSGRYYRSDGYLYGVRKYFPDSFYWDDQTSRPVENGEYFLDYEDVGSDGCSDEYEDGSGGCSDTPLNLGNDPNGDNWDPYLNPGGTEGNHLYDYGEGGDGYHQEGDRVEYFGDNVLYDPYYRIWFRDIDGNGQYSPGSEWDLTDSLTFVDENGNGIIDGELYYDADGNGEWTNHRGDNALIPMSPVTQLSLQAKHAFQLSANTKLAVNMLYSTTTSRSYSHKWKYAPDGRPYSYRDNFNVAMVLQHTLSSHSYFTLRGSVLGNFVRSYYRNIYPVDWNQVFFSNVFRPGELIFPEPADYDSTRLALYALDPSIFSVSSGYKFYLGGISRYQSFRMTRSTVLKGDFTSQPNPVHQIRAGCELSRDDIFYRSFTILYDPHGNYKTPTIITPAIEKTSPNYNAYQKHPYSLALYLQDKIELEAMIVNVGVRYEIFQPDGEVPVDPADPNPYNPLKLVNIYHDLDGDGEISEAEAVDSNRKTDEERLAYWFRKAGRKVQLSPRLAVAYPITDKGVLHFSYGHFFQIPPYAYLYTNPDFEVPPGSGLSTTMGNADLEPQRTVQYEVGLQQQFGENLGVDVTGFYKDIRNLLGSKIVDTWNAGDSYALYVNRDYGNVRGVTIAVEKRLADGWQARVDYTYSVAEGNASDPASAYWDALAGREPEKQQVYLDWDQRHTLNTSVQMQLPLGFHMSVVGQFGSGLPYTPSYAGQQLALENSARKPAQMNVDLRVTKDFKIAGLTARAILKVYNLLDRRNERRVYSDTGRAGYTLISTYTPEDQIYNSLSEYLARPDYYTPPRQVRLGLTVSF